MRAPSRRIPIEPGKSIAVPLTAGTHIRVVNEFGGQVVDTWAFSAADASEFLSMEHSRSATYRLLFRPGDALVSNRFNPMLQFVADTSPGLHDTLHAACSPGSYRFYGHPQSHPSCEDNLKEAMLARGVALDSIPCPWNLFEHARFAQDGTLADEPSAARPGDYVELQALLDLVLVCSACPSTVGQISGREPRGASLEVGCG